MRAYVTVTVIRDEDIIVHDEMKLCQCYNYEQMSYAFTDDFTRECCGTARVSFVM